MLNIFVNTWGNYNTNGAYGGEWITLPMDADELEKTLERIAAAMGDNDPEWATHDYEWTTEEDLWSISEYDNIDDLNETLNELTDLQEWEQTEIMAAIEAYGYEFKEAYERQQRGCFVFYEGRSLEELAEEIVNDCYFTKDTPDILTRYFDYEAFARDLRFDGYTETTHGVILDN